MADERPQSRSGTRLGRRVDALARIDHALGGTSWTGRRSKVAGPMELRRAIATLESLVVDPTAPERDLAAFLTIDTRRSRPFAPVVDLDGTRLSPAVRKALAETLTGHANDLTRRRRQKAVRRRMEAGDGRALLVAEGDSWFHFPIFLKDVVQQLGEDHLVWDLGGAGEQLVSMVQDGGTGSANYQQALDEFSGSARALLLSGGGNDLIGKDSDGISCLTRILRPHEPGHTADWYLDTADYHRRLVLIESSLRRIFADVATRRPGLPVLVQGYDYALPFPFGASDRRRPAWARRDAFLGATFRSLGIADMALAACVVRRVIDDLNAIHVKLAGGSSAFGVFPHVFHVDIRGTLERPDWADELHPTDRGYAKVADRFRMVLRRLGIGLA